MKTVLLVSAVLCAAAAVPQQSSRIIGGSNAVIENYNFMASMQYFWFNSWWAQECGGSLITSTTILSAAHCYHTDPASSWRAQVGSTFANSGGQAVSISQLIIHPNFDRQFFVDDIAIIRLTSSVTVGASVGVAQIAGPTYILPDNTNIWVAGWGRTSTDSFGQFSEILQHVQIPTVNWQECHNRYAALKALPGYNSIIPVVTAGMSCTGLLDVGGKDACGGDSGGPVVHNNNVVYGITSWGVGCANSTYPGVNAHVPYYVNWILANAS